MDPFLRVGLELPVLPSPVGGDGGRAAVDEWLGAAGRAGTAGFGAVWLTGGPGSGTGDGASCDPCTLAGGLVEALPAVVLGVVAVVGTGRNPAVVAREVTALDVMSGGRAAVLFRLPPSAEPQSGASWELLAEAVAVCRAVLTDPDPVFEGRHFHVAGAVNRPSPVRPGGPPVLAEVAGEPPGAPTAGGNADGAGGGATDGAGGAADTGSTPAATVALAGLAQLVEAVVVGGPAERVSAWRRALDRSTRTVSHRSADRSRRPGGRPAGSGGTVPLLWRGPARGLGQAPDEVAAGAAARLDAGAAGLVVRADPAPTGTGAEPGPGAGDGRSLADAVADLATALGPLAPGPGR